MDILKARKKALDQQKGEKAESPKREETLVVEKVAPAIEEPKPKKQSKPKPAKKQAAPAEPKTLKEEKAPVAKAIEPAPEPPKRIVDISAIPKGARSPEEIELAPHDVHDLPGTQDMPELPELSDDEIRGAVELGGMVDAPAKADEVLPAEHHSHAKEPAPQIEEFDAPPTERHKTVEPHHARSKKKSAHEPAPEPAPQFAPEPAQAAPDPEVENDMPEVWEEENRELLTEDEIPMEFLSFLIGREEYGLPLYRISETIKPRDITEVPRVPHFVLGILTLRGVVIPIFDLSQKLSLGTVEKSKHTRIIIVNRNEEKIGLMVDRVKDVVRVLQRDIEPPPPVLAGVDRQFIQGVGRAETAEMKGKYDDAQNAEEGEEKETVKKLKKRLVILLDPERVAVL